MAEQYDIIVIGGGISGLGVSLESALGGRRTLLLEKDECCRATSDNSLRIIHGGMRYLQTLDLARTRESIEAQAELLDEYPSFVEPLSCVMPLKLFGLKSRLPVGCAARFYNVLSRHVAPELGVRAKVVSGAMVDQMIPLLKGMAPHGALIWHDAIVPRAREFAGFLKHAAEEAGAEVMERTLAKTISVKAGGCTVDCESAGRPLTFSALVAVNASGPWLKRLEVKLDRPLRRVPRGWCKAFNLVLNRQFEPNYAVGVTGRDGRLYFTVPRGEASVAGTFYTPYNDDPDNITITEREVSAALRDYKQAMPRMEVNVADIKGVEAGILPVKRERPGMPVMCGVEQIFDYDGYIEVLSTKYTTFRTQARRVLKLAAPRLTGRPAEPAAPPLAVNA